MSLVIGIKCSDGIVVGADSAATFGGLMRDTIRQTARKIHVVDGRAIIGTSGLAGLGQRYRGELHEILTKDTDDYTRLPPYRLMVLLQQRFTDATQETMNSLVLARKFSDLGVQNSGLAGSLVAMKSAEGLALFSFDHVCNPEVASEDLPFVCVGSGQFIADPFLAHLKRVLWGDRQPAMALGILGLVWTLQHAIGVNPGGIAAPFHILQMTLNPDGKVHVDEMDSDSVRAMEARITDIEQRMREFATLPVEGEAPPKRLRPIMARRKSAKKSSRRPRPQQ